MDTQVSIHDFNYVDCGEAPEFAESESIFDSTTIDPSFWSIQPNNLFLNSAMKEAFLLVSEATQTEKNRKKLWSFFQKLITSVNLQPPYVRFDDYAKTLNRLNSKYNHGV